MADASSSSSSSSSPADVLSRFLATSPTLVQDKIRHVFHNLNLDDFGGLIQVWSPVKTTGGRWLLTTSDQPFINENHDDARKYRLCSVRYQYNIDMNHLQEVQVEEDPTIINGAPARAFLNRMPELVPDLRVHRMTPLESSALKCGLFHSVMLPVFYPSQSCCVGVVECCGNWWDSLLDMFDVLSTALEKEGLKVFDIPCYKPQCGPRLAVDEISAALNIMWPKFHLDWPNFLLDVAQVWIPYNDEDHVPFSSSVKDTQTKRVLGMKLTDDYWDCGGCIYACFIDYISICNKIPLKMGEGLKGQTLEDHKPRFIKKVSKLIDNQPLMIVRHSYDEGDPFECSCFVICLRSIETGDLDYVFEFLWHQVPNYAILLESLLLFLKKCLPNFKYAFGGEIGDELRIIDVENSTKSKIKYFTIFKGNKSSSALEALEERINVVKECLMALEAECKTTPASPSKEGMIEAAKNFYVSLSTLKRKRKDESEINEEDKGVFQDPSANNGEMYLDENTLIIKAECGDDMIKFTIPTSSATFAGIVEEIGKRFKLDPANFRLKYLDKDGDWILLTCDEDMKVCRKEWRNLSRIVRLRLLPQLSDPYFQASGA